MFLTLHWGRRQCKAKRSFTLCVCSRDDVRRFGFFVGAKHTLHPPANGVEDRLVGQGVDSRQDDGVGDRNRDPAAVLGGEDEEDARCEKVGQDGEEEKHGDVHFIHFSETFFLSSPKVLGHYTPEGMKVTERDATWDRYYQESLKTQTKDDAERLADSIWMFRTRSAEVPPPPSLTP